MPLPVCIKGEENMMRVLLCIKKNTKKKVHPEWKKKLREESKGHTLSVYKVT